MRNILGLLVVAVIVLLAYKFYFSKLQSSETGTPAQTISIVGVKNDLMAIAQAERAYMAEHGVYVSLDQLNSTGAMTMMKSSRDGYTYEIEATESSFKVVAHCPASISRGCSNWYVDQTMEVQPEP